MEKIPTKQRILDSALALFSQKGYEATGVEEIARDVGIKAPSIYKHFSGKEAILEALLASISEESLETIGGFSEGPEQLVSEWQTVRIDEWVEVERKRVERLLGDPHATCVRKFLTLEQFRDRRIATLLSERIAQCEIDYYERLFSVLMEKRLWKDTDAHTASDALIGNFVSHDMYLHVFNTPILYHIN